MVKLSWWADLRAARRAGQEEGPGNGGSVKQIVRLKVNGIERDVMVEPHHTLLEVLRRDFDLFGVREGCGIGMCGACTVLVNGKPISSCLVLAPLATGKDLLTVEGLSQGGQLHPIQQAYVDHTAFQCSYCTPGFILTTKALLEEIPSPSADEVREYLAGNLCRCGSYVKILDAVLDAAQRLQGTAAPTTA
jgi:carbon-monoxide dehydrogenase small subunit/isoquinoline 1-oxidoreductase alpha subunit/xanthine dehydrogenase YagT iron-sulfur-binding subunit